MLGGRGRGRCRLGVGAGEAAEAGEHGAEAVEERQDLVYVGQRREAEESDGFEGGGGFGRLAACAAEAGQAIGAGAARSLGNAEKGGEQRPSELIGQVPVPARKSMGDAVSEPQSLSRDRVGVETVVIELEHAAISAGTHRSCLKPVTLHSVRTASRSSAAFALWGAMLCIASCRPFKTSMGQMTGSLSDEVPGHPGCYYRSNGNGALCSTTPRQQKYDRAVLADRQRRESQQMRETWTRRWVQARQIELESDPHYSLLTPEIRPLSDGSELWTFREGGDCRQRTGAQSVRDVRTSDPPIPFEQRVVEQECRNPDRISQFRLYRGIVTEARLTTLP